MKNLKLNLRTLTQAERETAMEQNIAYWDGVRDALANPAPIAVWSIFEAPMDANAVAVTSGNQRVRITYRAASHPDRPPVAATLAPNPSFRDVYETCAALIVLSGDKHHVFIEALDWNPAEQCFEMLCGS